jgi:hypothetical protein
LFDPTLNFTAHVRSISSKIAKSLFVIHRVKNFLTPAALKALYYSFIHSHLIYCTHIWSIASPNVLTELSSEQKIAVRLIHGVSYNKHTESLFKSSAILPLDSLTEYFKLQLFY